MTKSIDNRLLGLKIAYYWKKKRLTQAQLAEKINISIRYMSKIECGGVTGSVSLPVLNRISNELYILCVVWHGVCSSFYLQHKLDGLYKEG